MSRLDLDPNLILSLLMNCYHEEDPNPRLTETTEKKLREFCEKLDPASATNEDLTFLLQYLKASDVPSMATPHCVQVASLSHASMALQSIAKILTSSEENPRNPVNRIVQAWPELQLWFRFIAMQWMNISKQLGMGKETVDGFKALIPFFSAATTIPELRDVLLTEPIREQTFNALLFCWTIETSELFISQEGYDPSLSAVFPLATLIANDFKPRPAAALDIFRLVAARRTQLGAEYDPTSIAKLSLTLLRNHPPSLDVSNAHMQMLNLLGVAVPYSDALLAQHSIRDVTRFLTDLTSKPYDSASAPKVLQCITSCMEYLTKFMPTKDGFSNVRMALQAGLLPAILRCSHWVSEGTALHDELLKALHTISLYIIYPSVLRPFLASVRKIEKLDIVDKAKPLCASYTSLVQLVYDRIAQIQQRCDSMFDLSVKCETCGKTDTDATYKGCSGCFGVSYCSESCQKENWESHKPGCESIQAQRKDGQPLVMSQRDADGIFQYTMSQVNLWRAEIARVWKEEGPIRTPLVSFDFTEDPTGVMVVGKRCPDTPPGKTAATGVYVPELRTVVDGRLYYNSLWLETISRTTHDTDAIVCAFLPQGDTPKGKWSFMGVDPKHYKGTVFESLVRTVEEGQDYGEPGPPVFFDEDKLKHKRR
ncbi:hypothetical protein DFH06DRAFT_1231999 [Mycena polygramma]|nr:hypothetical protein DFH06DRAFT_1231999 [Mycena polygramma]